MIIIIPDWILFAVLFLIVWRVGRRIFRFVEHVAARRRWQRDRIDYYNMAKHRVRFEEAMGNAWRDSGPTGSSGADAGTEALR